MFSIALCVLTGILYTAPEPNSVQADRTTERPDDAPEPAHDTDSVARAGSAIGSDGTRYFNYGVAEETSTALAPEIAPQRRPFPLAAVLADSEPGVGGLTRF